MSDRSVRASPLIVSGEMLLTVPYKLPNKIFTSILPGTEKACLNTKSAERTAETCNPSDRPFLE